MNKTKIVASLGPNSYKEGIIEEMIINGADVICLDMSYSDYNFCEKIIYEINEINRKLSSSVAIMLDLEGFSIKTSEFKHGKGNFKTGDKIRMFFDNRGSSDVQFSINYNVLDYLKNGQSIKLSNGKVVLEVIDVAYDYALCLVIKGGIVSSLSNVYFVGLKIERPFLTDKNKKDIKFASDMDVDFLVISNVYGIEDILEFNDLLIELNNNHISTLVKINNDVVLKELDKVIDIADGFLIARNDLAISVPIESIPVIKNEIIYKCRMCGKISIISADLASFLRDENPSRSEVSDLDGVISLGVDAISLSSETTSRFPILAIKQVEKIINVSESNIDYENFYLAALKTEIKNIRGMILANTIDDVLKLECKGIVATTSSGLSARILSRFRPPVPIIAVVPNDKIARSLNLHYGVIAVVNSNYDFDFLSTKAKYLALEILKLKKGDKIVIVGGHPFAHNTKTNFIKLDEI